jgi:hypothetical protein
VKNWRWWIALPIILPTAAIGAFGWLVELLIEAFFDLIDWVESGVDQ